MSDAQATGTFGPATQAGLRSQGSVGSGSSDGTTQFVHLFRAAMVFNGQSGDFSGHFDDTLAGEVASFQQFSQLPETRTGDFPTWASLLVSTGDPTRPGTACDCSSTVTAARAQALVAAGYRVVGRYLTNVAGSMLNKRIQPGELDTIFGNGLSVFPIYQTSGGSANYFTYTQGYSDALAAHVAAESYGFNAGTVIYFAVDYDATDEEIDVLILPYFQGVNAGLRYKKKKYFHGVYGSRNVCTRVTQETLARWSFVGGMSTGFSGNMGFPLPQNWSFNQIATTTVGSGGGTIEIDKDIYKSRTDAATSLVHVSGDIADAFISWIGQLYQLAVSYGHGDPNQRVLEYLRHDGYDNWQFTALYGGIDEGFIAYVDDTGLPRRRYFLDPASGDYYEVGHFGSSCDGVFLKGQPDNIRDVNRADFGSWGGDWITFYADWDRVRGENSSGYTFCMNNLARLDVDSSFSNRDLIEDIDAYTIGMALRAGTDIVTAVRAALRNGGGYLTRYGTFYQIRFGSDPAAAAAAAKAMLTPGDDILMNAARTGLLVHTTFFPWMIPGDKLDEFCKGFADTLLARVGQEDAMRRRRAQRAGR
jgi:peptidoglycan hydrolase-like protein with peptidoglycan-binding domain